MDNISEQSNFVNPLPAAPAKKSGGKLVKIIIILAALGIIGGGVALATRIWDPLWSPFRPSPEKVLGMMSEKMADLKTVHSEVKFSADIEGEISSWVSLNLNMASDITDLQNPKGEGDFSISAQSDDEPENNIFIDGKMKVFNRDSYFNFSRIDLPPMLDLFLLMAGVDSETIKNVWVKMPSGNLNGGASDLIDFSSFSEKTNKIISGANIYVIKKEFPDKMLAGQKMYNYLVALDNDKFIRMVGDLMNLYMEELPETDQPGQGMASLFGVGMVKGVLSEFLDKIGEINFELFIGKKDNFLYKLTMRKELDLSAFDVVMDGKAIINIETNISGFDEPVTVTAPESFKTMEELMQDMWNEDMWNEDMWNEDMWNEDIWNEDM